MSPGLKTTFDLLATTPNEACVELLVRALDSTDRSVQVAAVRAIMQRRNPAGQHEIIQRIHRADEQWKAVVDEHRGELSAPLRAALVDPDPQTCANGCQAILWCREYDLMPALVNALEDPGHPRAALAAQTLLRLSELLYEELASPRDYRQRRDPQLVRRNVTGCLEDSARRFSRHRRHEPVEALLRLADRDDVAVKQILLDPLHGSFLACTQVLTLSEHPGVIRLVLSFLDDPQAPAAALAALSSRVDRHFVELLLRRIAEGISPVVAQNLKRITSLAWLARGTTLLDELPAEAQARACTLFLASGLKHSAVFSVLTHLLTQGRDEARAASVRALASFEGPEADACIVQALDDPFPGVQVAVAAQLRGRGVHDATARLLELLDSDFPEVRQAAREQLPEYRFHAFLHAFDGLGEAQRQSAGRLVRKVDLEAIAQLREELRAGSRKRRLRAIDMAEALEVLSDLEDELLDLLTDEHDAVRAEAARALGRIGTDVAIAALHEAERDSNASVRDAAGASLHQLASHGGRITADLTQNTAREHR